MSISLEEMKFGIRKLPALLEKHPVSAWDQVDGVKQRKARFPPADPAQIMRAGQKDSSMINFVEQEITGLMREILRSVPKRENIIQMFKRLSQLMYYGCTSLAGLQTLGEEYSGILMISGNGHIPSKLVLLEMVFLKCFGDLLISFLLRNGFFQFLSAKLKAEELNLEHASDMDSLIKDLIFCLPTLNSGIFYLTGDYYDISKRLTGIRYVLVHIWLYWKKSHSGFRILGVVSLVYSLTQMIQVVMKYNRPVDVDVIYQSSQSVSNAREFRCPFCFETRRNPAVTPCGHLFCWKCIIHALQVDNKCPICRERVDPSRVVILRNYHEAK